MGRLEWQTKLRILTCFGLLGEGGQVAGVLSVRTNPYPPHAVALILVASATIRVYPPVAIGASLLTIMPTASQNLTTLGIEFISLVAKYQNWWSNMGISSSFILFQDQYLLVCLLTVCSSVPARITTSPFIGL